MDEVDFARDVPNVTASGTLTVSVISGLLLLPES